jgi:ankyrin repeat protein
MNRVMTNTEQYAVVARTLRDLGATPERAAAFQARKRQSRLGMEAAMGRVNKVRALIKDGADINGVSASKGATALMAAVWYRRPKVVALLLKAGADVSRRDEAGKTALMYAEELGCSDIVQMLGGVA